MHRDLSFPYPTAIIVAVLCFCGASIGNSQSIAPPADRPAGLDVASMAGRPMPRPIVTFSVKPQNAPAPLSFANPNPVAPPQLIDTDEQLSVSVNEGPVTTAPNAPPTKPVVTANVSPAPAQIAPPKPRPNRQITASQGTATQADLTPPPGRPASIAAATKPSQAPMPPTPQAPQKTGFLGLFTNKSDPPSNSFVAQKATKHVAIPNDDLLLLGVFGKTNALNALVQLPSGRVKQVKRGDKVAGGQISAITKDSVSFTRNGQTSRLRVPKG